MIPATIHQATLHHAAALAAIHARAFPHAPWSEASFHTLLGQPGIAGFIDAQGGLVLTRTVADEAEILTIGVTMSRQGLGKALMLAAIRHVTSLRAGQLHLEVAASNIAARALYKSLGFAQTGQRPNYYPGGVAALILSLPLHPDR